jgi:toluene monooxygenase system protein E
MKPHDPVAPRAKLKTYSHLASGHKLPNEYEIATSQLLYYVGRGFAVETPLSAFYRTYQGASPFTCASWETFRDPRETTYARYTRLMSERDAFVRRLFDSIEEQEIDAQLSPALVDFHDELLAPLRHPAHGLQMVTAYIGQMAPSGRIVAACAFQAGDELRRIQHLAYRLALVRRRFPTVGSASRARWQDAPVWQPLRRVIEQLLVTWDWGEAFAALCLCVKPVFDRLVHIELAERVRALGDYLTNELLSALDEEARWHRAWARALVETAILQRTANRDILRAWVLDWSGRALAAVEPILGSVGVGLDKTRTLIEEDLAALDLVVRTGAPRP